MQLLKFNPLKFFRIQPVYASLAAVVALSMSACAPGSDAAFVQPNEAQYTTLAGKSFSSASLKGKVTLVNFWATSCTTCVKEMPMMVQHFNTYESKGYRHIAVAMDYDPAPYVRSFAKERALPFDVVHDTNGSIAKSFGNVKLTPTSFLLDKQGKIVKRYVGAPNEAELKATIEQLLAQS